MVPTVTDTEVPLRVVPWKGSEAIEIADGPKPLPCNMKMLPGASGELNGRLPAAFAMFVIVGAADAATTTNSPAESRFRNRDIGAIV